MSEDTGAKLIALMRSISATLEMKADQTFHISAKRDGIEQVSVSGKWTLEGGRLTMAGQDGDGEEMNTEGELKADGIHFEKGVAKLGGPAIFKPK